MLHLCSECSVFYWGATIITTERRSDSVAAVLAAHALVALLGRFQCDKEEIGRKLLFVSTRRVRPFQQGTRKNMVRSCYSCKSPR